MDKTKQTEVLKYLLGRIYRADKHKNQLDARLENIIARRRVGNMPAEDDPTSIKYWISDIESRILEQKKEIDRAVAQVMDIIDYLPMHSIERQICELRHIDCKPWGAISAEIPMSRTQVYRRHKSAIKLLLENQRIQVMTEEHENEYDTYMYGKGGEKQSVGMGPENRAGKIPAKNMGQK